MAHHYPLNFKFTNWIFNRPTDVAFGLNGEIYVSDGYLNSRVVKYSKDGDWIKASDERGTCPGQFHTAHTLITDAKGLVYVGDRENKRVQVFDPDGKYLLEGKEGVCLGFLVPSSTVIQNQ